MDRGFEMATNTYQTTTTRYELASIEARFAALFIDSLVLSIIGGFSILAGRGTGLGASFLIGLVYVWFFLTRNNGQTPGKVLMKIRVIKANGSAIADSDAIVRHIMSLVNYFFLLGWLAALIDANQQGWHDKVANTYVVNVK
jgi:uncharacterized RDD family membrane protein YckC